MPRLGAVAVDGKRVRVSVALCTHNGAEFLGEQLSSILGQSRPPHELVLSDDASTDGTVELAAGIMAGHPEVDFRVLRNDPPLGVTKNFERAVKATTGELIALSDQDDVWHSGRLERIIAEFEARPELLLLHGDARLVDASGSPLGRALFEAIDTTAWELERINSGHAFEALVRRNLATGATVVFRRDLLERALPFPGSWVHDEWLAVIAAASGHGTVDFLAEPLVDYRQHGGNQIGARKLGPAGKLRRLMEPRRQRNARLVAAFDELERRLAQLPVAPDVLAVAREKAEHERVRNRYPEGRLRRVAPVLREFRTGRYALSGRGLPDVVRDLLQPVD